MVVALYRAFKDGTRHLFDKNNGSQYEIYTAAAF